MGEVLGRYLGAVKKHVATTLRPRELGELALKHSHYTEEILGYLVVATRDLPTLTHASIRSIGLLLPELTAALRDDPVLAQELQAVLAAGGDPTRSSVVLQKAVGRLLARPDPSSAVLVRRIAAIELDLRQRFYEAITKESMLAARTVAAGEGLSPEQRQNLTQLLRKRYPHSSALEIGAVRAIPGGFSKQTIFLELRHAKGLPGEVVLRIDKADSPVETTVVDEFEIIEAMYTSGVPVPNPLMLEPDKSILGGAFVLVSRIDGSSPGDHFEVANPQRSFGVTLAQAVAKIHAVTPSRVSDRVPGARLSAQERMLKDVELFESKWRMAQQPSLTLEMAYAWLRANIACASSGQRAIVHRDIGCNNLLVKDGRLTAILDWETAVIGDPAHDLGYLWHTVVQVMPWEEFLGEYERAGGKRPPEECITFYRVWRHVWLMTMQSQVKTAVEAGYADDLGLVYNALNLFQRLSVSLQALLCEKATS